MNLKDPRGRSQRIGMTLLEVMIALSLAALLLVSISGLLGGLIRQNKRLDSESSQNRLYALTRLFWHDLAQAEFVSANEDRIRFVFSQGLLIEYATVKESSGGNSLKRRIARLNDDYRLGVNVNQFDKRQTVSEQTVLWDVTGVSFSRLDQQGNDQPIPATLSPCPKSLRYRIRFLDGSGEREISRVVTVR